MKLPIVVGIDLTEASDDALIQAEARATRDGVPLTVVHAMTPLLWDPANDSNALERAKGLVRQRFTALTGRSDHQYAVVVERGLAHTVLAGLAISQHALLVVGSHMRHGVGHAFLRDVTERVVARARGPVLVTRPRVASERVLVAVDRPFESSAALDIAIDEARSSDSKLTVLHCVNMGFLTTLAADLVNGGAYADRPLGQRSPVAEARQLLNAELGRRRVDADLYIVEGAAQQLISEVATSVDADLVVVGTAHRPAPTPHVTTAVLRHAPCSVLIVDELTTLESACIPLHASRL
ncbi:MAG TPA: universal stress protein [Polyangiaceae bacterium]